jgi:hypothetical protein
MMHVQAYDSLLAVSRKEGISVRDAALNADLRKVRMLAHSWKAITLLPSSCGV